MIKLKNIKRNDFVIECDIIPEDSKESGHVVVELVSGKLQNYSLPSGYEWCRNHVNHAVNILNKLREDEQIPNEKLIVWY